MALKKLYCTWLNNNFNRALGRLKSLFKRLSVDKELLTKYNDILREHLNKKVIEIVNDNSINIEV